MGTVYEYSIMRQARVMGLEGLVPYTCVIVEIDEEPAVFIAANLIGISPDEVRVGMRVKVRFEPVGDGEMYLPQFVPAEGEE
jgi:hypothetical protein